MARFWSRTWQLCVGTRMATRLARTTTHRRKLCTVNCIALRPLRAIEQLQVDRDSNSRAGRFVSDIALHGRPLSTRLVVLTYLPSPLACNSIVYPIRTLSLSLSFSLFFSISICFLSLQTTSLGKLANKQWIHEYENFHENLPVYVRTVAPRWNLEWTQ